MTLHKFGSILWAVLATLPLAANAADRSQSSSSDSEKGSASAEIRRSNASYSYRGTGISPLEGAIGDALARFGGGATPTGEIALLEVAKPMIAPGGGGAVIGADQRKTIAATKRAPYRWVALITFNDGSADRSCTGWFISKNMVATAAHCLHPGSGGAGAFYPKSSYTIYPGANGLATPYGSCGATRLFATGRWTQRGNDQFDFGAIKLDCNIGTTVGWFGYFWKKGSLKRQRTLIAGYPDDKPAATMWRSKGRITVSQKRRVFYKNDTADGMDGAPVYFKRRGCGTCAMAVHTRGTYGNPPFSTNNHGTRITKAVFRNFNRWKK